MFIFPAANVLKQHLRGKGARGRSVTRYVQVTLFENTRNILCYALIFASCDGQVLRYTMRNNTGASGGGARRTAVVCGSVWSHSLGRAAGLGRGTVKGPNPTFLSRLPAKISNKHRLDESIDALKGVCLAVPCAIVVVNFFKMLFIITAGP